MYYGLTMQWWFQRQDERTVVMPDGRHRKSPYWEEHDVRYGELSGISGRLRILRRGNSTQV